MSIIYSMGQSTSIFRKYQRSSDEYEKLLYDCTCKTLNDIYDLYINILKLDEKYESLSNQYFNVFSEHSHITASDKHTLKNTFAFSSTPYISGFASSTKDNEVSILIFKLKLTDKYIPIFDMCHKINDNTHIEDEILLLGNTIFNTSDTYNNIYIGKKLFYKFDNDYTHINEDEIANAIEKTTKLLTVICPQLLNTSKYDYKKYTWPKYINIDIFFNILKDVNNNFVVNCIKKFSGHPIIRQPQTRFYDSSGDFFADIKFSEFCKIMRNKMDTSFEYYIYGDSVPQFFNFIAEVLNYHKNQDIEIQIVMFNRVIYYFFEYDFADRISLDMNKEEYIDTSIYTKKIIYVYNQQDNDKPMESTNLNTSELFVGGDKNLLIKKIRKYMCKLNTSLPYQ